MHGRRYRAERGGSSMHEEGADVEPRFCQAPTASSFLVMCRAQCTHATCKFGCPLGIGVRLRELQLHASKTPAGLFNPSDE